MRNLTNLFCALVMALTFTSVFANKTLYLRPTFEGSEHILLGNSVKLYFSAQDPSVTDHLLNLPNSLPLSYGDIIALGDLYEIPNVSIAQGRNESEKRQRFMDAFNSFAIKTSTIDETKAILSILHDEKKLVEAALQRGEDPEAILNKVAGDVNRQLNCVTGGGCDQNTWFLKPGRYLTLANTDFDHFSDNAWTTYQIGHDLALEQAQLAHNSGDIKQLELAYAMNAFASHFLSDRFAVGHIRTPRYELYNLVTPHTTGSVLAGYMHREENSNGLHVHNERGDRWLAYGDKSFFSNKNIVNRELLMEAMQASADEIFSAYHSGKKPPYEVIRVILPHADEVNDHNKMDISPMFYFDSRTKKLMRRLDLDNLYDQHYTSNWWGWSTLLLLAKKRGVPPISQGLLAQEETREKALQLRLIESA